jgi:hypothetical protein
MRTVLVVVAALTGCQAVPNTPAPSAAAPASAVPAPCDLAGFGAAPGEVLSRSRTPGSASHNKSEPLQYAEKFPLNRGVGDTGKWATAGPGWKAWRYWLRSETARSVSVRIDPLELPPYAELWLCTPDRATRKGPITGKGFGDVGRYWSPDFPGAEVWVEVLAPAGTEKAVKLVLTEAFAAAP